MSRSTWRRPVKIADALTVTLQRLGLQDRIRQHDIYRVWPLVVGREIARHAQPHAILHGRLIVHVSDSVWLHHLSMMRHRLVPVLNEQLAPAVIREMVLRIGEVPSVPAGPSPKAAPPEPTRGVDPARLAEIDETLAAVGDAPFRDALRRIWLRSSGERRVPIEVLGKRRSG
jgi:hypothetical protein